MVDKAGSQSEILYREGKALGVDRGDDMIRDRIAFKDAVADFRPDPRPPEPTESAIARLVCGQSCAVRRAGNLSGFYLTPPTDQATAQRQLDDILQQHESEELQNQTRAILGRPVESLAASLRRGLPRCAAGDAGGTMETSCSPRMAGTSFASIPRRPGTLASFESVQDEACQDLAHRGDAQTVAWEAVKRLKASYQVRKRAVTMIRYLWPALLMLAALIQPRTPRRARSHARRGSNSARSGQAPMLAAGPWSRRWVRSTSTCGVPPHCFPPAPGTELR